MRINNCDRKKFAKCLKELVDGNEEPIQEYAKNLQVDGLGNFTIFGIGTALAMAKTGLSNSAEDACEYMNALAEIINSGTCKNEAMKDSDEFLCSKCGEHVDIAYMDSCDDYHVRYCPYCGREVDE